ncbi:hypothetical protein GCM10010232_31850 [Streptomyces amakusaensis]
MNGAVRMGRNRYVRALLVTALAVAAAGCTKESSSPDGGGAAAASCAYVMRFADRTYQHQDKVKFEVGEKVGTAHSIPCNDTGQDSPQDPVTKSVAYAVEGLDPDVAVAIGDSPQDADFFSLGMGREMPAEVEKFIARR